MGFVGAGALWGDVGTRMGLVGGVGGLLDGSIALELEDKVVGLLDGSIALELEDKVVGHNSVAFGVISLANVVVAGLG